MDFKKVIKNKVTDFHIIDLSLKTSWNQISLMKLDENFEDAHFLALVISGIYS